MRTLVIVLNNREHRIHSNLGGEADVTAALAAQYREAESRGLVGLVPVKCVVIRERDIGQYTENECKELSGLFDYLGEGVWRRNLTASTKRAR